VHEVEVERRVQGLQPQLAAIAVPLHTVPADSSHEAGREVDATNAMVSRVGHVYVVRRRIQRDR